MYEHVKTGCKHIPPSEQPLQFQSGYFFNKARMYVGITDGGRCSTQHCTEAARGRFESTFQCVMLRKQTFVSPLKNLYTQLK